MIDGASEVSDDGGHVTSVHLVRMSTMASRILNMRKIIDEYWIKIWEVKLRSCW